MAIYSSNEKKKNNVYRTKETIRRGKTAANKLINKRRTGKSKCFHEGKNKTNSEVVHRKRKCMTRKGKLLLLL